jgi:hypothetical protein
VLEKYCLSTFARFENVRLFTWEEVLKHQKAGDADLVSSDHTNHASVDDCWIVIDERVYDVTKWLPIHPGKASRLILSIALLIFPQGGKALLLGMGKDSTYLFEM